MRGDDVASKGDAQGSACADLGVGKREILEFDGSVSRRRVAASAESFRVASTLHRAGKFAEAEFLLSEALARDPTNSDLCNARGVMFAAMGRHLDAVWCYRDALTYNPNGAGIWTNLGNALLNLNYVKSAVECHERALTFAEGDKSLLYHNLGIALTEAGRHAEAIVALTRAIEHKPDRHMAQWDRALNYLYLGNYRRGWVDYEARLKTGQLPAVDLPGLRWHGEPYAGKRLLLLTEQGLGDTIWVARYLSRVKALGGELVMQCRPELIPLIETMAVADKIIPQGAALPSADFHCYQCSLPSHFSPDAASIPSAPYFTSPHERMTKFRTLFAQSRGHLRVGVVWSGSTTFKKNHRRAQQLSSFLQAFALPLVQLYSLQKGSPAEELASLPSRSPIIDVAPYLDDFADTAAAIAGLDLIIMTDSAVAHLAGAVGKPVWVLLGHVAHWLWLLDRTDSPWYPSVRLFRPRAEGDWQHVFDSASFELMRLADDNLRGPRIGA